MSDNSDYNLIIDQDFASLVCDYVQGKLPPNLVQEVESKMELDLLFRREVSYYKALFKTINRFQSIFDYEQNRNINNYINQYFRENESLSHLILHYDEIVEREYRYRRLFEGLSSKEDFESFLKKIDIIHSILDEYIDNLTKIESEKFLEQYSLLIPDFINEKLDERSTKIIRAKVAVNSMVAKEVEFQRELAYTVRRMERESLKERLTAIVEERHVSLTANLSKGDGGYSPPFRSKYISIAAIVTLFILSAGVAYLVIRKDGPTDIAVIEPKPDQMDSLNAPGAGISLPLPDDKLMDQRSEAAVAEDHFLLRRDEAIPSHFRFADTNSFAFASSSALNVNLYRMEIKDGSVTGYYLLKPKELSLFIPGPVNYKLYNLSSSDAEMAEVNLKAGLYLLMNEKIYYLKEDEKRNLLQPLSGEAAAYIKTNL
jgi:hypothetical protein